MGEVSNYCCFVIVEASHVSYRKSRDVRHTPVRRSGYSHPQHDHYDNHWLHHSVQSPPHLSFLQRWHCCKFGVCSLSARCLAFSLMFTMILIVVRDINKGRTLGQSSQNVSEEKRNSLARALIFVIVNKRTHN